MAVAEPRRARWREYDDVYVGILCCLISTFLFWVVNALGKVLTATYPIPILVFFRSLFALIMCMVLAVNMGGCGMLRARQPRAVMARGAVWLIMIVCSFASYHLMPIGDAAAIEFTGPIFIAVLATIFLGEIVVLQRWLAILAGFVGVLLVVRPGFGHLTVGMAFAFGNALCYAIGSLMVRHLSRTEGSLAIVFYSCLLATMASGVAVPFFWVSPTGFDLLLFCAIGVFGAGAQYFVTLSFYYAPASTVAPFSYSGLVWALLLGVLIWDEVPDVPKLLGLLGITVSGLWLAAIKTPKRHPARAAASMPRPRIGSA